MFTEKGEPAWSATVPVYHVSTKPEVTEARMDYRETPEDLVRKPRAVKDSPQAAPEPDSAPVWVCSIPNLLEDPMIATSGEGAALAFVDAYRMEIRTALPDQVSTVRVTVQRMDEEAGSFPVTVDLSGEEATLVVDFSNEPDPDFEVEEEPERPNLRDILNLPMDGEEPFSGAAVFDGKEYDAEVNAPTKDFRAAAIQALVDLGARIPLEEVDRLTVLNADAMGAVFRQEDLAGVVKEALFLRMTPEERLAARKLDLSQEELDLARSISDVEAARLFKGHAAVTIAKPIPLMPVELTGRDTSHQGQPIPE